MRISRSALIYLALCFGIGGAVVRSYLRLADLERASSQPRQPVQRAEPAPAPAGLPSLDLRPLEDEVAALTRQLAALKERPPTLLAPVPIPQSAIREKAADWKNAGRATPEAAFETVLWALANSEVGNLTETLRLTGVARTQAEALFSQLSKTAQDNFGSVEGFIGAMALAGFQPNASLLVNERIDTTNQSLVVLHPTLNRPGQYTYSPYLTFQKVGETWQLVVPESAIAKYAGLISDMEQR